MFQRRLPLNETGNEELEVYQFADPAKNRTLYIAWRNVANQNDLSQVPLQLPATAVVVKAMGGAILQTINDGDDGIIDGRVSIGIDNRPYYLEVKP
jgi:hypothetical protein